MHYKFQVLLSIIVGLFAIVLATRIVSAQDEVKTYSDILPRSEIDFVDFTRQNPDFDDKLVGRVVWKNEANKFGYIVQAELQDGSREEIAIIDIPEEGLSGGGEIILNDLDNLKSYKLFVTIFDDEGNTSKELPISFIAQLPNCEKKPQGIDYVVPDDSEITTAEPSVTQTESF